MISTDRCYLDCITLSQFTLLVNGLYGWVVLGHTSPSLLKMNCNHEKKLKTWKLHIIYYVIICFVLFSWFDSFILELVLFCLILCLISFICFVCYICFLCFLCFLCFILFYFLDDIFQFVYSFYWVIICIYIMIIQFVLVSSRVADQDVAWLPYLIIP
jgi:hypothetical protein